MKLIPNAVSQKLARQVLLSEKNAPSILFGVGVAGMIGSTVLACRATLQLSDTLERAQHDLETAKDIDQEKYDASGESRQKDIAIIYTRSVLEVTKLYLPAAIVGGVAIACLTKSHNLLQERNTALVAAYAAVDGAFRKYRERVVDKYGEDEDRNFRYGAEEVDVVDDDGKISTQTRVLTDEEPSMYARFFDEHSTQWSRGVEGRQYNMVFLRGVQSMANNLLLTRGHLFLNEVYDALGLERTKAGQVVGWVISKDGGDNFIDFGIYNESNADFVNGREGSILLDFNVDGVIYDKISE